MTFLLQTLLFINHFFLINTVFASQYWSTMCCECNSVDQIEPLFKLQKPKRLICHLSKTLRQLQYSPNNTSYLHNIVSESSFFPQFHILLGTLYCISQDIYRAMTQLLWQNCIAGFQSNFQPWLHDTLGKGKEKHFSQSGLSLSLSLYLSLSPRLFWRWSILSLRAEPKPLWWGCQLCINNRMFTAQALHVSSLVPERQKSHVHSREHSLVFRHVWNHRGWVRIHFKAFLKPWIMQSVHANLKQQLLWRH